MNTKTKLSTVIETVVQDLARAADEDSVIDQWGLSVAEIEEDLTPEQLQQSQDWLDALVAGARLKFTEDDVTYYYENGKYYSVYGDDAAYDGSNPIGEPEEVTPEMMAVILLGIHLDAGTLHVVGESGDLLRAYEATGKMRSLADTAEANITRVILRDSDYDRDERILDLHVVSVLHAEAEKNPQAIEFSNSTITMTNEFFNSLPEKIQDVLRYYRESSLGRVVGEYEYRNRKAVVRRNAEWGEFVVQFFSDGQHMKEADYGTDDKADAVGTARAWVAGGTNPTEAQRGNAFSGANESINDSIVEIQGVPDDIQNTTEFKSWIQYLEAEFSYAFRVFVSDSDDCAKAYVQLDASRDVNSASVSTFQYDTKQFESARKKIRDVLRHYREASSDNEVTEREMLDALVALVKEKGLRVSSPDYQQTKKYAPQWKILGNQYYYQLPGNGLIVAKMNDYSKKAEFNPDGLPKPTWDDVARAKAEATTTVSSHEYRGRKAVVKRDKDTDEYVVQFYSDGVHMTKADYFTDDKNDAQSTAKAWTGGAKATTEAAKGEDIAQRNKGRDGQPILDAESNEIPNSVVFSSGYGGAYSYSGRLVVYSIDAITGEMAQVELGEDALPYFAQLA